MRRGAFEGAVVVVTGAGSGIGEATARRFAAEGASVVCGDRSGREALVASDIGDAAIGVHTDVSDEASVIALIGAAVSRFGGLDVLCNVAGVMDQNSLVTDIAVEDWDRMLGVNARGAFLTTKHALPHLVVRKGAVVNVSSIAGALAPGPGNAAYCASKAAIIALTRTTALEFGLLGVRANAVLPGVTLSPPAEAHLDAPTLQSLVDDGFLGRPAKTDEIAAAIAFLASPDASYITGAAIPVDGGASASFTSRATGDDLTPRDLEAWRSRSLDTGDLPFRVR